ncbi:DUF2235 domain-containing protein [Octadecabacter sp. CECT 8868]|uniref:DUF2235 domain-containing protein n=1 Tax=Octadecabacter algicola TaxID=2909342 RepID=UPI001F2BF1E6|nr:DUF2235 domain-containing protein [Octadecabacter algicola]MCF2903488.1 DUF2235 domain-containing protein [Octadecabacter algicola]
MKRIAIFIDGTWNRPDAKHPTNVVRLAQCVRDGGEDGMPQVVSYQTGVGAGQGNTWLARRSDRIFGGALGWGLTAIIENAYRDLVFLYEPGDEICVFGFSRGAFAARSLVGLIRSCGIPSRDRLAEIPAALDRYRSMDPTTHPNTDESHDYRLGFSPRVTTSDKERAWREKKGHSVADVIPLKIAYLGVWDTVSALGAPEFLPISRWTNTQYRFHDAELSSMVLAARHAISIDERRITFPSYPWSNMPELNEENESRLIPSHQQLWFAGNHGAVGGGGDQIGLSSISLNWIALGAARAGLALDWSEMDKVAWHFDAKDPLDNKFGPVGLSGLLMNGFTKDRVGPKTLDEMSMAAVDRAAEDQTYRRNPSLEKVYPDLHRMTPEQRDAMRAARKWADGGFTHLPDEVTRPREWL